MYPKRSALAGLHGIPTQWSVAAGTLRLHSRRISVAAFHPRYETVLVTGDKVWMTL